MVLENLPVTIRGFTVYQFDDGQAYYTIFINSRLAAAAQLRAYDHEINHINKGDFDKMFTADWIEVLRHVG